MVLCCKVGGMGLKGFQWGYFFHKSHSLYVSYTLYYRHIIGAEVIKKTQPMAKSMPYKLKGQTKLEI